MMPPVVVAGLVIMAVALGWSGGEEETAPTDPAPRPPSPVPDSRAMVQFTAHVGAIGFIEIPPLLQRIVHSGSLLELENRLSELDAMLVAGGAPIHKIDKWVRTADFPVFGPDPVRALDNPNILSWDRRQLLVFDAQMPAGTRRYRTVLRMDRR